MESMLVKTFLQQTFVSIRELAQLLVSSCRVSQQSSLALYIIGLWEHCKVSTLRLSRGDLDGHAVLSQLARAELAWWISNAPLAYGVVTRQAPALTI